MNPLHKLRARAYRLGIPVLTLIWRRQIRELRQLQGFADEHGTIHFKPPVSGKRELRGWVPKFNTLYNEGAA